jgi:hypothetical protein
MQDKAGEGIKNLAVLIDADNVSAAVVEAMLSKISELGYACVKRMYGDWTTPSLGGWKKVMLEHALQPIQQFAYTTGKNSTDGAMMIDAMDLMYTQRFDGFCICSSDSDFTRLAMRLREQGLAVYGFGEHKTPVSFVSACSDFTYIETFKESAVPSPKLGATTKTAENKPRPATAGAKRAIYDAIEACKDGTGWCAGALLGNRVSPKSFGCKRLKDMVGQFPDNFEIQWRDIGEPNNHLMFVRNKRVIQNSTVQPLIH